MTRQMIFVCLLILSTLYALVRGGRPEQVAAATLALGVMASIAFAHTAPLQFHAFEAGILVVDIVMVGAFLLLATRSTRFWPIWIAGILGAETIVHLTRSVVPEVVPQAYIDAAGLWSWIVQALLIVGTWRHRKRLQRFGSDAPWRAVPDE